MDLDKSFEPAAIEAKWYPFWESRGLLPARAIRVVAIARGSGAAVPESSAIRFD